HVFETLQYAVNTETDFGGGRVRHPLSVVAEAEHELCSKGCYGEGQYEHRVAQRSFASQRNNEAGRGAADEHDPVRAQKSQRSEQRASAEQVSILGLIETP